MYVCIERVAHVPINRMSCYIDSIHDSLRYLNKNMNFFNLTLNKISGVCNDFVGFAVLFRVLFASMLPLFAVSNSWIIPIFRYITSIIIHEN